MLTYGDAVCDVNISSLVEFHKSHGKMVTLTAVFQKQKKGILDIGDRGTVRSFREKRREDEVAINAGYMVVEPKVFEYLKDDQTVFENLILEHLASEEQLMSYQHTGFWQCMDSSREHQILEAYWKMGNAPWKVW